MLKTVDIDALITKIRQFVGTKRIRLNEFFRDFDGLRHYKVSKANFIRILDSTTLNWLTISEVEALCSRYVDSQSGDIKYKDFIEEVDLVFRTPFLEQNPLQVAPMTGEILPPRFEPIKTLGSESADDLLAYLLRRMRLLVNTRGVVLKYHYQPFDKIHHGTVTYSQFIRAFPFPFWSEEDRMIIADKYSNNRGHVNYQQLHDDVTSNIYAVVPENPTSILEVRKDPKVWEQMVMSPEKKLQALVVMNRIRVKEFFLDFDNLRSGYVTRQQARSIFDSLLAIKIPEADWEYLVEKYSQADGKFNWRALCNEIDEEFMHPELEKSPDRRSNLPNYESTLPARRNKMFLSDDEVESINRLETDLRRLVFNSRKDLLPIFLDFDRTKRGHVTKHQFARALSVLGFEITALQLDVLALRYCDLGNHTEINYREFIDSVDPKPAWEKCDVEDGVCKAAQTHIRDENVYFNKRGSVVGSAQPDVLKASMAKIKPFTPYEY